MNMRSYSSILVTTLLALAIPISGTAAQKHHHYKLIDMGTLGGDASYVNFGAKVLNDHGAVVGSSETSTSLPPNTNPYPCPGPNSFKAFVWQKNKFAELATLVTGNCSNAIWVNKGGKIAGDSENGLIDPLTGITEVRAVVWENNKIRDLGTFGGNHSASQAINTKGEVTGFALNETPDLYSLFDLPFLGSSAGTQTRAFLWSGHKMHDLDTLGGPDAFGFFVNDSSQVSGISYTDSIPNQVTGLPTLHPFLWQNGKMKDLGTLGGLGSILSNSPAPLIVNGLNNRGEVIGFSPLAGDQASDPFLWNGERLVDMSVEGTGGTFLSPNVLNDEGLVAGAGAFPNRVLDAALWENGRVIDLGAVGTDCFSEAWAISSDGQVGGVSVSCDGNNWRAFLWQEGSMVDLNTLIPPGSSLQLVYAIGINDRGEIAGNGVPVGVPTAPPTQDTMSHAFLLIPCDEGHPNLEGCDYSLVDATSAAQRPADASQSHPVPQALLQKLGTRPFGIRRP
jgi:probable HAF family extracellular repeat protein